MSADLRGYGLWLMRRALLVVVAFCVACPPSDARKEALVEKFLDDDGDGYGDVEGDCGSLCSDCDDTDRSINPAAKEICDGIDNNCDDMVDVYVDEDHPLDGAPTLYADLDRDGYGAGDGVPPL